MQCISISVMLISEVMNDSRLVWLSAAALFGFLLFVWVFFHLPMSLFNWICRYFSVGCLTESHTTHVVICLIQCCSAVWHWSKNIAKNWWWWNFAAHETLSCLSWTKNMSLSVPVQYLCGTFAEPFHVAKAFQARQITDSAQLF